MKNFYDKLQEIMNLLLPVPPERPHPSRHRRKDEFGHWIHHGLAFINNLPKRWIHENLDCLEKCILPTYCCCYGLVLASSSFTAKKTGLVGIHADLSWSFIDVLEL
jgi:hypothetical protein